MKKLPKFNINYIKKLERKKLGLVFVGCFALLVAIAGILYYLDRKSNNDRQVDCSALTQKSKQLLQENKPEEAYDTLKSKAGACGALPSEKELKDITTTEKSIELATFNAELAKAGYLSGDKEKAKEYAEKASVIVETLSQHQRQQIPENKRLNLYDDIYTIKKGIYIPNSDSQDNNL